jgi:DNA-binding NarL/FixJ family response regulator
MASDPAAGPVRIVLVDDHAIVRQGLRSILERQSDLTVVGEASTAAEARVVVSQVRPTVVLLDLKLSTGTDVEGLDLCEELTRRCPDLGVLVLSTFLDDALLADAVRRGAQGYVVKDVDTTELLQAIRAVARHESAFDARSAAAMVRSIRSDPTQDKLTPRELKVVRLMATGMSNKDIGAQLYISVTTVKFHVRNIMRKLDVNTRAGVVYEATKLGVL